MRGQASVEFVAVVPLLVLAALSCVQALLLALTLVFAQASVQAASRQQVTSSQLPVPAAWRRLAEIHRSHGRVVVTMRSPAVLPAAAVQLRADSSSQVAT